MTQKIALAGVPNCGKTTFWNLVTGRREKTGNWPGATTEKNSAILKAFPDTELIDIPGTYSLSPASLEESSAKDFLLSKSASALIIIIDGTKPEQGLYFALELLSLGIPAAIGINFSDELDSRGIAVNTSVLKSELSVPVFMISAKTGKNIEALLAAAKAACGEKHGALPSVSPKQRREKAAILAEKCFRAPKTPRTKPPFPVIPFFAFSVLIALLFFLSNVLNEHIDIFFKNFTGLFSAFLSAAGVSSVLISVFAEGLIPGAAAVVSFIPDLFIIFFLFSFIEDCGLMSRFAFLSDSILKKAGLSGRAAIPLLLGFGCTVPAVFSAKASSSEHERSRILSALMFIPCSARFPLVLMICKFAFAKFYLPVLLLIYILVPVLGFLFIRIVNQKNKTSFILEIPDLRTPSIKSILKTSFLRVRSFVYKAGAFVVLTSVLMWLFKNFSLGVRPVELQSESALFSIGCFLSPVFAPIGIPPEGAVALFCGLLAKESALFALLSLSASAENIFSPVSAISFLLFYMIYPPCVSCLAAISKEFGIKKVVRLFIRQTLLAYSISFAFFQFALLFENIFIR